MAAALTLAGAVVGCGKKGPPLTPVVRVPDAVTALAARRVGNDVYVTMTLPARNIDGSMPASLARVDIYGATSLTPPSRARFLEIATRVASVPVQRAPDPERPGEVLPAQDPASGAVQGAAITLRDALDAADLTPRQLRVLDSERRQAAQTRVTPLVQPTVPRRFYMAIPIAHDERPGPPSAVAELPLTQLPEPPGSLRAEITATGVALSWEPAGGLIGWWLDQGVAPEVPPFATPTAAPVEPAVPVSAAPAVPPAPGAAASTATAAAVPSAALPAEVSAALPPGPTLYNVYREIAPDPLVLPPAGGGAVIWDERAPAPVNPAPQPALGFADAVPSDERLRCYVVRSVRGAAAQRVEGAPSNRVCVMPIDASPPETPTGLQAIAAEGAITLIWEPNVEEDLGGYLVLRRDEAGDTLQPLTPAPINEARFIDRTVTPGMRYTYEVRAVDSRIPLPNVSASAEVSETAR